MQCQGDLQTAANRHTFVICSKVPFKQQEAGVISPSSQSDLELLLDRRNFWLNINILVTELAQLGRFSHRVGMSVYLFVCLRHWV